MYYTHLALPAQETPIDDVEEVLKRVQAGKVKVGAVAGTFTEELLLVRFWLPFYCDIHYSESQYSLKIEYWQRTLSK